jgi:hypothetical protein
VTTAPGDIDPIADRLAIIDLIHRYFDATDAKRWDLLEDCYTQDAVVWCNPERSTTARAGIVGYTRAMLGSDEIVTYHHVASFTPVMHGATADGWRRSGYEWPVVVGLGSVVRFDGLRPRTS